jgi:hypothetical protein
MESRLVKIYPAFASQVLRLQGMCHHTWLRLYLSGAVCRNVPCMLLEMKLHNPYCL